MTADFKSHVLRRDEKGFLSIPFKRWLLAGVCGGLIFAFASIPFSEYAMPLGGIGAVMVLIFTAERRGMPLWLRLLLAWRGRLILAAFQSSTGVASQVAQLLKLPVEEIAQLEGEAIFIPPHAEPSGNFSEWVTLAVPSDADGLVFIEPLLEG
jgi:hypothetical protein